MNGSTSSTQALIAPSTVEKAFTVSVLLLSTGAFMNLFLTREDLFDPGAGLPGMQWVWSFIYLVTLFLLVRHCNGFIQVLLKERWIVFLVILALVSVAWSSVPWITLRRGVALAATCLFGVYLAMRYSFREQLKLLAVMSGVAAIFNFVFGVFGWGASVDDVEGAWYGIYVQKNGLGIIMAIAVFVFFLLYKSDAQFKWFAGAGLFFSGILILLSRSMSALLSLLFVFALLPLVRPLSTSIRKAVAAFGLAAAITAAGLYWIATHLSEATEAVGRDETLTGRVQLWVASVFQALERPWLGYGYSSFWRGNEGPSITVWQFAGWAAPSAHNGLLDIWLDLGLVGVAFAVVGFALYFRRSVTLFRQRPAWSNAWPLLFLAYLFLINLTASEFLTGNSIFWLLFTSIAYRVSLQLAQLNRRPVQVRPVPQRG
jgi:exopolysaccharide production protein ExoQ